MATKVTKFNSGVIPTSDNAVFELEVGVYAVRMDQFGNYFLEPTSTPSNPTKVYGGDTDTRANRFLDWFVSHPEKSLGTLLIGEPGSGKTLLMRRLINMAIPRGISVIMVERGYVGESFNRFIHESLKKTSAIVCMDEFEKLYNMNDDEQLAPLLTLFEGPNGSHKMFVCTANNRSQIADPFFNRPGRIRYIAEFGNVGDDVIIEYVNDNLINPDLRDPLRIRLIDMDKVNFDCLVTAVSEVNRMNDVDAAFADLNIKDKYSSDASFALVRVVDRQTGKDLLYREDVHFRPQHDIVMVYVPKDSPKKSATVSIDDDDDHVSHMGSDRVHLSVDRSIVPTRKDGCFVFVARNNDPESKTKVEADIYIKNHYRMFAF